MRRSWRNYSKLGRKRKKKQVWRKPTGRDNKMREKRRGYPVSVNIGYKTKKQLRGTIDEKAPIIVKNIKDLNRVEKNNIIIIGKIGKKKKIELTKRAKEMKLEIHNLNMNKFLKKVVKTASISVPKITELKDKKEHKKENNKEKKEK